MTCEDCCQTYPNYRDCRGNVISKRLDGVDLCMVCEHLRMVAKHDKVESQLREQHLQEKERKRAEKKEAVEKMKKGEEVEKKKKRKVSAESVAWVRVSRMSNGVERKEEKQKDKKELKRLRSQGLEELIALGGVSREIPPPVTVRTEASCIDDKYHSLLKRLHSDLFNVEKGTEMYERMMERTVNSLYDFLDELEQMGDAYKTPFYSFYKAIHDHILDILSLDFFTPYTSLFATKNGGSNLRGCFVFPLPNHTFAGPIDPDNMPPLEPYVPQVVCNCQCEEVAEELAQNAAMGEANRAPLACECIQVDTRF